METEYLSKDEIRVLNELMDNDENVESIHGRINYSDEIIMPYERKYNKPEIIEILKRLYKDNYLECVIGKYDKDTRSHVRHVLDKVDFEEFENYWFGITQKGRDEVNKEYYEQFFPSDD